MSDHSSTSSVQGVNAASLAKLLKVDSAAADEATIFTGSDLASVLKYQLAAPLEVELAQVDCGDGGVDRGALSPSDFKDPTLKTFAQLFAHPKPLLDVLKRAKDFAKSCRANPELLPPEVATLFYYAAIVAARLRLNEKISELDDAALRKGSQWVLQQKWVDEATRGLFSEAVEKLK